MKIQPFQNNCKLVADHSYCSKAEPTASQLGWQIEWYDVAQQVFRIARLIAFTLALFISHLVVSSQVAVAAGCGAEGQRGCKITFKRLKTCNKGLHINLKTKRCVRNKKITIKPPTFSTPKRSSPEQPVEPRCGKLG